MQFDWKDLVAALLALIGTFFITLGTNVTEKGIGYALTVIALILLIFRVRDFWGGGGGGRGGRGSGSGGNNTTGSDSINVQNNGHRH